MNTQKLIIKCTKDGICIQEIVCQHKEEMAAFAHYIKEQLDQGDEGYVEIECDPKAVEFLIDFCNAHDWKQDTMKWQPPWLWKSNDMKDYVDQKSYNVFKEKLKIDQIPKNPSELEKHAEKLAPIIDLAFTIRFDNFKKISNCALQIPLFIDFSKIKEESVQLYKDQWQLNDDLKDLEVMEQIKDDYQRIVPFFNYEWQKELDGIKDEE